MDKLAVSDQPSSVQMRRPSSSATPNPSPQQPNVSEPTPASKTQQPTPAPRSQPTPTPSLRVEPLIDSRPLEDSPYRLDKSGRSMSNLAISGSQLHLNSKEPTPSIASDISNTSTAQDLQKTIQQLQKYVWTFLTYFDLSVWCHSWFVEIPTLQKLKKNLFLQWSLTWFRSFGWNSVNHQTQSPKKQTNYRGTQLQVKYIWLLIILKYFSASERCF